jgi:uncharacterized protein YbcC (UPF0753/DUF2309 family)
VSTNAATSNGPSSQERASLLARLKKVITQSGDLLPAQGPITAFVFLNTLQALEHLPFDEGIRKGASLFGCQPYLPEELYRQRLASGRIQLDDIATSVREDLGGSGGEIVCGLNSRHDLRLAMLRHPLRVGPAEELRWFVAETDALRRVRPEASAAVRDRFVQETRQWALQELHPAVRSGSSRDNVAPPSSLVPEQITRMQSLFGDLFERFGARHVDRWSATTWEAFSLQVLWRLCRDGGQLAAGLPHPRPPGVRFQDVMRDALGEDLDAMIHDVLVRFCAAFTDQGFARWALPQRDAGFYTSFRDLYRQGLDPPDRWRQGLRAELNRLHHAGVGPLESVEESLRLLGVREEEWSDFIPANLLALRGWAGMLWQMEVRGDRVPFAVPGGSLVEFLAVRLILKRQAVGYIARTKLNYQGPLCEFREYLRTRHRGDPPHLRAQRAFTVFQLSQLLGWSPPRLFSLKPADWERLIGEIEAFSGPERRRVLHQAFERRFHIRAMDALAIHGRRPVERVENPAFQAVFCIDSREESFRRHLEEVEPRVETYGAAGFFGVAMYYKGVADAHFAALCPIVVRPRHWVTEEVLYSLQEVDQRMRRARRAFGRAAEQVYRGSRGVAVGALLTAVFGVFSSIPLVARVLFPRLTAWIRRMADAFIQPPLVTRLRIERTEETPGSEGERIGFNLDEMACLSERQLGDIGLTRGFSRLVLFLGHGSSCLNNPHKSAYDCGACSGSAGGPNARALAAMLNDPRVRDRLARRGLNIPAETVFLGGQHNTSTDTIAFFDIDLLPKSHIRDFESARETLWRACERNAHERCRRFRSARLDFTLEEAHEHVEVRAEDLAQTRPEFGNATNAIAFVGRRGRTRNLFLDRRSFLVSYDPTQDDPDGAILGRILSAIVPVCSGINLQYFFSSIDNRGWGAGTKLPHNVTSLLGVMDGSASDMRTGLPWQGVEIHEPVRLLFVMETTPTQIEKIMDRDAAVSRILRNGWVQLALLHPDTSQLLVYRNGTFHPHEPSVHELRTTPGSFDWYRGWRDHLDFAVIEPAVSMAPKHVADGVPLAKPTAVTGLPTEIARSASSGESLIISPHASTGD